MKIILASSNQEKIKEIKARLPEWEIWGMNEVCDIGDIPENGETFKQNALIKSKTLYDFLQDKNALILSDDSGLSVAALGGEPGVFSARYAGKSHHDSQENNKKLIAKLKEQNLHSSPAFYTSCMALSSKWGDFCVHGFMHGKVIDELRGQNGFGYDPLFIPQGWSKTLGEEEHAKKLAISHRSKALNLAIKILNSLPKG